MEENQYENNKVNKLINDTFLRLRSLSDTETIIGDAIKVSENLTIVPISKATIGFVLGGGEYVDTTNHGRHKTPVNYPMAGGSGGGVCLTPIGFLVMDKNGTKFLRVTSENDSVEKVLTMLSKAYNFFVKDEKK